MNVINIHLVMGLESSGKSTFIEKYFNLNRFSENTKIFKANEYALNYSQKPFQKVMDEFRTRILEYIEAIAHSAESEEEYSEYNIVIEDSFLRIKARKVWLAEKERLENKLGVKIRFFGYLMNTPYDVCRQRIESEDEVKREGKQDRIILQHKGFEIPFMFEGYTKLSIIDWESLSPLHKVICDVHRYSSDFRNMMQFDQENPHHKCSLGEHMNRAYQMVLENQDLFYDVETMKVAALIHDWGKYFTKSYNKDGYGIYYEHGQIGAYYLLSHSEVIPTTLKNNTTSFVLNVLAIVNYHMRPFDWKQESTLEKEKKIYGDLLLHDLIEFNKIDRKASGTAENGDN